MDFTSNTGPKIGAAIPHTSNVTSLSYHSNGEQLFAATESDSRLYMINALDGQCSRQPYKSERDGVSVVSATHHEQCVLTAGHKSNDVQYWSLFDNKTLRKFRGHAGPVIDMSLCPAEDMFLTASKDRSIRLWSLDKAGCIARLDVPKETEGTPHVAFDSTGMVFAAMASMAGGQGHYVHLYDARNYHGGAFAEMKISTKILEEAMTTHRVTPTPTPSSPPSLLSFKSIEFNQNGNQILVQSEEGLAVILDGYDGAVQRIFQPSSPTGGKGTTSCFTPDDKSVLIGTENGTVECWDVVSGRVVKTLEGHKGPVGAVAANPKYNQIASSCSNTCLWIW
mmetsp:Transcript_4103/g.10111  ORF Transcript_4103/g.10111 Transcript_4103/m.10111 type:complete len:337 (-) Transcript_4103:103-1113(-)